MFGLATEIKAAAPHNGWISLYATPEIGQKQFSLTLPRPD